MLDLKLATALWQKMSPSSRRKATEVAAEKHRATLESLPNVIAVGSGIRTQRARNADGIVLERSSAMPVGNEPVVSILVSKKWKSTYRRTSGRIPSHLFIDFEVKGETLTVAVPTDIESVDGSEEQAYGNLTTPGLAVWHPTQRSGVLGAMSCLVADENRAIYGVSCEHVLGRGFPQGAPLSRVAACQQANVCRWLSGSNMTPSSVICATSWNGYQLDAALVAITDPAALELVQGTLPAFKRYLRRGQAVPERYTIFLPDYRVMHTYKLGQYSGRSPIKAQALLGISYESYVISAANTVRGHSGSPVGTEDGLLLGWHFGGNPELGRAYMLPAWLLFDSPGKYFSATLQPFLAAS